MINTFAVKGQDRVSDSIFESFNRFHDAKLSGALRRDELSRLLVSVGDLFANKIKQGKVSKEEIESLESHLSGFTGENSDKYFAFPHEDLKMAAKSVLEGNDFALQSVEQRYEAAQPVMESDGYERTFRKLGH